MNKSLNFHGVIDLFKTQIVKQKYVAAGILAFSAIYGATNTGVVLLIKKISSEAFFKLGKYEIKTIIITLLGLVILRGVFDIIIRFFFIKFSQSLKFELQQMLYRKLHYLPIDYFKRRKVGDIVSNIVNDVAVVNSAISTLMRAMSKELWTILGILVALFFIDARLTLLCMATFPLFIITIKIIARKLRVQSLKIQKQIGQFLSILTDTITAVKLVKLSTRSEYEIKRFADFNRSLLKRIMRMVMTAKVSKPITETLIVLSAMLCLLWGLYLVDRGTMERSKLISFVIAIFGLYSPISIISGLNASIQRSISGLQRLSVITEEKEEPYGVPGKRIFAGIKQGIVFNNVCFSAGGKSILENVSFEIPVGKTVAIVGRTGQGKSTVLNMLPRLIEPEKGSILFDGVDYREFDLLSLRKNIAYATQDVYLFNTTIRENIAYAVPNITDEAIENTARKVLIHEFIIRRSGGYKTMAGENGNLLSGGERQRISLARELVRETPLLLLDESTSEVDYQTEKKIFETLVNLNPGRTVLIVSHRLISICGASMIVVIEGGKVHEVGTHEELISHKGLYWELFKQQREK
jgi:ABC-type multidrug transport system fused ATPase/permease subunit